MGFALMLLGNASFYSRQASQPSLLLGTSSLALALARAYSMMSSIDQTHDRYAMLA